MGENNENATFSDENAISFEDDIGTEFEGQSEQNISSVKRFPPAIRRSIEKIIVFLLVLNAAGLICIFKFGLNLYLFAIVCIIDLIMGGLAFTMYLSGKNNDIITFDGYVYNTLEHGIAGLNKSYTLVLYNEETEKFLCLKYLKYVEPATPVTVYMSRSANITMSDNGPYIESYLAIKFSKMIEDEELNESMENGNATIEEYLTK